jgi:hypothetical protein
MAADPDIVAVKIQGIEVCIFHDFHHDYIFLKKRTYQHVNNSVSLTGRYLSEATLYAR